MDRKLPLLQSVPSTNLNICDCCLQKLLSNISSVRQSEDEVVGPCYLNWIPSSCLCCCQQPASISQPQSVPTVNSADHKTRRLSLIIIHAECVKIDIELDLQMITVSFTLQGRRVFKNLEISSQVFQCLWNVFRVPQTDREGLQLLSWAESRAW